MYPNFFTHRLKAGVLCDLPQALQYLLIGCTDFFQNSFAGKGMKAMSSHVVATVAFCLCVNPLSLLVATVPTNQASSRKAGTTEGSSSSTHPKRVPLSPAAPFDLTLGSTTLEKAEARWTEQDAGIVNRSTAAVGAGSGVDGQGAYSNPHIVLVDIRDLELEGAPPRNVRFAFFDKILFSVSVLLKDVIVDRGQGLDDKSLKALRNSLTQRYGQPKVLKAWFGTFCVWDFNERELVLLIGGLSSTLTYQHKALAKKAEASQDAVCRQHRPQCGR